MKFIVTAEHTGGQSIGHPCTTGIWDDPTDYFQIEVEADTIDHAEYMARKQLQNIVEDFAPCNCQRKLTPGWNSWWDSVVFNLWPQDAQGFDALGFDKYFNDPYGLIPKELKND